MSRRVFRVLSLLFVVVFVAGLGGQAGAASKKKPPGDPPGNNGTVKIEQESENDEDLGNEPHGENCTIWVEFYGFDRGPDAKGQTADITFELISPTKPKSPDASPVVMRSPSDKSQPGYTISTDQAGGGPNDREPDYTYSFNLTSALSGVEPHPKQGYHVRLSVDVRETPGSSKHKNFWMAPCKTETPASPAASTLRIAKEQVGDGQGPFKFSLVCDHAPLNRDFELPAGGKLDITDVPPGTTCKVEETDKKGADSTITEDPPFGTADDGEVKTTADKSTIVTVKNKFPTGNQVVAPPANDDIRPPSAAPAGGGGNSGTEVSGNNTSTNPGTSVLGATQTAPETTATLPRTGGDPRPLTTTGLSALAAGLALLAGSRRRRA